MAKRSHIKKKFLAERYREAVSGKGKRSWRKSGTRRRRSRGPKSSGVVYQKTNQG